MLKLVRRSFGLAIAVALAVTAVLAAIPSSAVAADGIGTVTVTGANNARLTVTVSGPGAREVAFGGRLASDGSGAREGVVSYADGTSGAYFVYGGDAGSPAVTVEVK